MESSISIIHKMLIYILLVILIPESLQSYDCTKSFPTYLFTSHPSFCSSINPSSSMPIQFPPNFILGSSNMSIINSSTVDYDYKCNGIESDSNCDYITSMEYVEFGPFGRTFIIFSLSTGSNFLVNTLTWVVYIYEVDFQTTHLEVVKKNSTFSYIINCNKTTCLYFQMNDFGNTSFILERKLVSQEGSEISSINSIVDPTNENVFLLLMINDTDPDTPQLMIQDLSSLEGIPTETADPIPTVYWNLPFTESRYRFSIHRQLLSFTDQTMRTFYTQSLSTESQDLVLVYNSSLLYIIGFNNTNISRSSDFSNTLFYKSISASHTISSVRGISQSILRVDHENSNCSDYIYRDTDEILQLLIILSFPFIPSNGTTNRTDTIVEIISFPDFNVVSDHHLNPAKLDEFCDDTLQYWNGTGCQVRDYVSHELRGIEVLDLTQTRYMESISNEPNFTLTNNRLSMTGLCEFFITSQRIYNSRDRLLMSECLDLLNSSLVDTCEMESFNTYNEIRRWVLYNAWFNQIYLFTTDFNFITLYYGMDVDEDSVYYEYPYSYDIHVLSETKLRGMVKDVIVSHNGFHTFVAHQRKRWELDSIERRFTICAVLSNRTIARKIKENLQNELMVDLIDEIRDRCEEYPPSDVSMNDFDLYFTNVKDGFYAPYFDRSFVQLPVPGYFSDFPLYMTSCLPGTYCRDGKASVCPSGYFCRSLSKQPEICSYEDTKFKTCFIPGQAEDIGLPCPIGHICPSQLYSPIPIPPGFQQNLSSFNYYLEYYEDVNLDVNVTVNISSQLNETQVNISVNGSTTVNTNITLGPPTNTFSPCDLGEWCPLYIFFDNKCPAGTECSETSQLLPSPCNYTLPSLENMFGETQYCPNGTYDAKPCPAGYHCEGPVTKTMCDLHFYCPEGTILQNICPGGNYCPTPSEKIRCPWYHFCSSGSVKPKRCSWLSICPPGMQYDRYNFVGIICIGGLGVVVFVLLQCLKRLSFRWKKIKRKKEAKSNWKELGKIDVTAFAKAFGIPEVSESMDSNLGPSALVIEEEEEMEIVDALNIIGDDDDNNDDNNNSDNNEEEDDDDQETLEAEEGDASEIMIETETGEIIETETTDQSHSEEEEVEEEEEGGGIVITEDERDFPSSASDQLRRAKQIQNTTWATLQPENKTQDDENNNNNNKTNKTNNKTKLEDLQRKENRVELRDIYCFPCDLFSYLVCCRFLNRRKKKKSDFYVDLGFDDLSLTVKSNGKVVLNGVTGEIRHGGVCAVMGLSGCGKSSFITTLAGRAHYGFTGGKIFINRTEENLSRLKKFVGFVPQEDVMMRTLTVEENISFSARTRLDSSLSAKEIRRKVDRVVEILGLESIRNSPIGDENVRGISGGQRKRVNIALELVADPLVLFLDEPTSGLDSSSSQQVCDALKRIGKDGINVVTVIHQPRYEIFEQFDSLLLLGVGGEIVYFGTVPEMMPYFETLGFHLEKAGVNPIDFAMDAVDGKVRDEKGKLWEQKDFFGKWKEKRKYSNLDGLVPRATEERKIKEKITREIDRRTTPTTRQFADSFKRALVMKIRGWKTFITDNILILVGGIFLGALFIREEYIGSLPESMSDMCPGFIRIKCEIPVYDPLLKHSALISLIISLGGVMSSLNTFGNDRAVFLREKSTGLSTLAEFLSRSTVDIINIIVSPWIFLVVYYTIKAPRGLLIFYVIILTGLHWASYGFGYFISILFNPAVSKIAGVVILLITFLFSGLNVTVAGMARWPFPMNLIPWVCFLRFSTEALYLIEITRLKDFHSVEFGMEIYGYRFDDLWWCIGALAGIGLVYRALSYIFWLQSVPTSTFNNFKSKLMYINFRFKKRVSRYLSPSCCFSLVCCCCRYGIPRIMKKNKKVSPYENNEDGNQQKMMNPFLLEAMEKMKNKNDDDSDRSSSGSSEEEEEEEEEGEGEIDGSGVYNDDDDDRDVEEKENGFQNGFEVLVID